MIAAVAGWTHAGEDRSSAVTAARDNDAVDVRAGGRDVRRYQLKTPADVKLPVDSGGYFHPVSTPSGAQLSQGLSAEGVGARRRYAEQLAPVLPTLEPWVAAYGYPPT